HAYGKGRVVWGRPLGEILARLGAGPDCVIRGSSPQSRFASIHRAADGADLYFVSNQRYQTEQALCTFRTAGKQPELWHPDTGRLEPAPLYREQGGRTLVPLRLDPAGSVFVVFRRKAANADPWASVTRPGETQGSAFAALRRNTTK